MDAPSPSKITLLLRDARENQVSALRELLPLVHDELRRIAGAQMRRERQDHTLAPTALVHEAFVRLADHPGMAWEDRAHFLGVASQAMRRVLVDHARARKAEKRGGARARVTLVVDQIADDGADRGADDVTGVDLLDLDEKLDAFRALHERRARVVELRFFGGLTFEESGHVLGVSAKTVEADWYFARAWLRREMRAGRAEDTDEAL